MRTLGLVLLIGLMAAVPAGAQGRGRNSARSQGIPPGQLPPPNQCRVWYDGRPPGQQPRAMDCNQAERLASRDSRARVIYGSNTRVRDGRDDRVFRDNRNDRDDRNNRNNRGINSGFQRVPFDNGYNDGYQKGREDARENRDFDPVRHSWYRDGSRGYDDDYGTKTQYRNVYREGFESGYSAGYRENADARDRQRNGGVIPGTGRTTGGVIQRWP
jgi:hypothetical protein